MTSLTWPTGLPQVLRLDGLSTQRKSSVVRTQMDAGPDKVRRRYTVSTKVFTGSIVVTEKQRELFEAWYRNVIADGTLRFVMKDPQTLQPAEFRFTEDYSEEPIEGLWKIAVSVEKLHG